MPGLLRAQRSVDGSWYDADCLVDFGLLAPRGLGLVMLFSLFCPARLGRATAIMLFKCDDN
jgi:hypothetical protein